MIAHNRFEITETDTFARANSPAVESSQVFRLGAGSVRTLQRARQVVRVISGCAWITLDGDDIVLCSGETVRLAPGKHPAVISGPSDRPVVYEIG
jgi:hypothetical protein